MGMIKCYEILQKCQSRKFTFVTNSTYYIIASDI